MPTNGLMSGEEILAAYFRIDLNFFLVNNIFNVLGESMVIRFADYITPDT